MENTSTTILRHAMSSSITTEGSKAWVNTAQHNASDEIDMSSRSNTMSAQVYLILPSKTADSTYMCTELTQLTKSITMSAQVYLTLASKQPTQPLCTKLAYQLGTNY